MTSIRTMPGGKPLAGNSGLIFRKPFVTSGACFVFDVSLHLLMGIGLAPAKAATMWLCDRNGMNVQTMSKRQTSKNNMR